MARQNSAAANPTFISGASLESTVPTAALVVIETLRRGDSEVNLSPLEPRIHDLRKRGILHAEAHSVAVAIMFRLEGVQLAIRAADLEAPQLVRLQLQLWSAAERFAHLLDEIGKEGELRPDTEWELGLAFACLNLPRSEEIRTLNARARSRSERSRARRRAHFERRLEWWPYVAAALREKPRRPAVEVARFALRLMREAAIPPLKQPGLSTVRKEVSEMKDWITGSSDAHIQRGLTEIEKYLVGLRPKA